MVVCMCPQENFKNKVKRILRDVGDLIKTTRDRRKMTMSELAQKAGVSSSVISDLENYKGIMPNIYTLLTIANALELPEETLLEIICKKATRKNDEKNINKLDKIIKLMVEYGVSPIFVREIIEYMQYFIAISKIKNTMGIITSIYKLEEQEGTKPHLVNIDSEYYEEVYDKLKQIEEIAQNWTDRCH